MRQLPPIAEPLLGREKQNRHRGVLFAILPLPTAGFLPEAGRNFITQEIKSMNAIYRWLLCAVIFLAAGLGASRLLSRENQTKSPNASAQQAAIERGKYLVENVAMCEECHTPRDDNGNLDESRRLQGASIWIVPVHRTFNWANRAPALAGFEEFTEEQGEQILEKGIGPNGLQIQPPMHIYHMTHADAQAVIAYLRSLPGAYPQQ
jgi:mono/diheme cytochrome c family protein